MARKWGKMKVGSKQWIKDAVQLAMAYAPAVYGCRTCGHPVVEGYCCHTCGSGDPEGGETVEDELKDYWEGV